MEFEIFHFDCNDELEKIFSATDKAKDLNLHMRISTHNNFCKVNLSKKFGIEGREACNLIKKKLMKSQKILDYHFT